MAPEISDDDRSEAADTDKLSDEYPPDELLASDDYGVTGAEQRYDEPLDERVRREQPEATEPDAADGRSERVVQPVDQDGPDEEEDLVAAAIEDPDVRDRPPDDEVTGDETTRDAATERVPPPAEEVALHIEDES
jgi:hypothetical protein